MASRKNLLRAIVFLVLLGAVLWAGLNREQLSAVRLDRWLAELGPWAPFAFVALYVICAVLFFPGSIFTLLGGAVFGPVLGTLLNLTAATIAAAVAFLIARYLAAELIERKVSGRLKLFLEGIDREGWRFVAMLRLIPVFPFNLTNYALGLTNISVMTYVFTSLITMLPGALAFTWLGHAGRQALTGNEDAVQYALIALAIIAAMAFVPRFIEGLKSSKTG